ncbi:MAG: nodulation protein NfeD [Gammaproteobacteria bacterium]|nr:nodulation protein NfeD [Gammaproteobacteria bacterium]
MPQAYRSLSQLMMTVILLLSLPLAASDKSGGSGMVLEINGMIGPATSDYLERALSRAETQAAELVILRMDTPGGLDTSMRAIIKRILSANVPVVTYVSPGGARAASAGTYILYASHVAAMAPGTNLGAATPVELGGLPGTDQADEKQKLENEAQQQSPADAKTNKLINDAAAYIRGLAKLRGRNAEWGEQAVRQAASLSAEEALEKGVIDLFAKDIDDLLEQLHDRSVQLPMGSRVLDTQDLNLVDVQPDWRSELLSLLSNPNVAYVLMLVGIYGLIYEFANPGSILPGTAGAISLLLAFYAFHVLPVNTAGMALILLGLALMIGEAFVPSFGALGIGGVIAFVAGSLILIDTDQPGYGISLPLIFTVAVASAFLLVFVVGMALKSRRRPVVSGREELLGADAVAIEGFTRDGPVHAHGEVWRAHTDQPVTKAQRVKITGRDGMVLQVTPIEDEEASS